MYWRHFFLKLVLLAVLISWAHRTLRPSGLTVLEIKIIMWKNDCAVQTEVILYCVRSCSIYGDDCSVLYHNSLPWGPKLGR
jgi:hypothetical protein